MWLVSHICTSSARDGIVSREEHNAIVADLKDALASAESARDAALALSERQAQEQVVLQSRVTSIGQEKEALQAEILKSQRYSQFKS
jgi:hypothetical protein